MSRRPAALFLVTLFLTLPVTPARAAEDTQPPVIAVTPCETFQKDRPFSIAARFGDASALFDPKLVYHFAGERVWKHVVFKQDGELWRATIPQKELTGALEYFVEVFDENGNGPSRVGSPEAPLFARVVKKAPECPAPDALPELVIVQDVVPEPMAVQQSVKPGFFEKCEEGSEAQPFYCKRWVWYATGGAVLATVAIVVIATAGGSGRDYPDRVTFDVRAP